MPHVVLEYTANIAQAMQTKTLLQSAHQIICKHAGANVENCKGRAVEHSDYVLGAGEQSAFVHLEVRVMQGRAPERLGALAAELCELLKTHFAQAAKQLDLQFSVNVSELEKHYVKFRASA